MPYFLVHAVTCLPHTEESELQTLRIAEAEQADELQRAGALVALWREAGRLAAYGIWCGDDEDNVRALVATLPLYQYMTISVAELHPHPNARHPFPFGGIHAPPIPGETEHSA